MLIKESDYIMRYYKNFERVGIVILLYRLLHNRAINRKFSLPKLLNYLVLYCPHILERVFPNKHFSWKSSWANSQMTHSTTSKIQSKTQPYRALKSAFFIVFCLFLGTEIEHFQWVFVYLVRPLQVYFLIRESFH